MTTGIKRWFLEPRSNGSEPRFHLVGDFTGRLDSAALTDKLAGTASQPGLNRGYKRMVLDLSRVGYMDSEGALCILQAYSQLLRNGCELVLVRVPARYRHKFELHGLHQVGMQVEYLPPAADSSSKAS